LTSVRFIRKATQLPVIMQKQDTTQHGPIRQHQSITDSVKIMITLIFRVRLKFEGGINIKRDLWELIKRGRSEVRGIYFSTHGSKQKAIAIWRYTIATFISSPLRKILNIECHFKKTR